MFNVRTNPDHKSYIVSHNDDDKWKMAIVR